MGRSRRGPPAANPLSMPSSNKEVHFDGEVFQKIENYIVEVEKEDHVQAGNPPLYMLASDVEWFEGVSLSGGVGPSTNRALPTDSDS